MMLIVLHAASANSTLVFEVKYSNQNAIYQMFIYNNQ